MFLIRGFNLKDTCRQVAMKEGYQPTNAEKPKYLGLWKGRIIEAVVLRGARTWDEIQKATGLDEEALNRALSELYDTKEIKKTNGEYRVSYPLFKDYKEFFKNHQTSHESKRKEEKHPVTKPSYNKSDLIKWINQWKEVKKLNFSLEPKHFFLEGRHLNDLSEELIDNAKSDVLIVNPFIEDCNLSKTLEDARNRGTNVTVITRPPDEKDQHLKEKQEYHSKLKEHGVDLTYNRQIHAKLIVVDNSIAIASSMNFYSASSGGRTWEAGIISTEETVVRAMVNSIDKLREKPKRKNYY